ncbi:MAG TPA: germination protein YpeB [Halanaerobiaceae bacterium]|nr:germination protein YpeB [Bacillota bacterium]HHU91526.1 germination protein YpeB [Halanaerobiaceae bacterium]HOA41245.1 germination protein YpeB [Halanaerobiales bacterium]HPZ63267.1 germination protein YpeB [Halanaerobiales bacterium]HQD04493.1 germination protein YpeB [Halanaerobiales bacterium]
MKINRSWIIPLVLALVLVGITAYWGYDQYREKEQLQIYMGNTFQQSFLELVERIEEMEVLMGKSLVSTSPRKNIVLLTDIWSHANTAQAELNKLPLAAQTVYDVSKFLSQSGDFAHSLARQNADGKVLTAEERQTLSELRQHAIRISELLQEVENEVLAGRVDWVNMVKSTRRALREEQARDKPDINLDDLSDDLTKVPTLIYDGPFSDHINERQPQGLKGEEVSRETARERVRDFIDGADGNKFSVSEGTTVNGRIGAYNFQVETGNGVYSVDISKKGGSLVSLLNNREVYSAKISMEDAVKKAQEYLADIDYTDMEPTFSEVKDNIAYISFAYQQDDIIFYPDIINVQIAMDNGQVLAVEAQNYLMSHKEREINEAELSEEEARELASSTLEEIESVRLAVIPTSSLREVFTYEVRGKVGEEIYIIYINAETGNEEEILKVILSETGTFAL